MSNIQDHFPPELLSVKQWVVHRNKIPVNPYTLYNASTSNPDTWSDFDTAFSVCKKGQADGVGFVFASGQGYVGIDIDTCIDPSTNSISDEALEIVKMFDTYTEISPSGYGLHMIIKADPHIPLPHNKYEMKQNGIVRIKKETGEAKIPEVEIYNEKRFFTCTGNVWGKSKPIAERTDILTGFIARLEAKRRQSHNPAQITLTEKPAPLLTDEELLDKAFHSADGPQFQALFNGDQLHYKSKSEADLAFCNKLNYWCSGNAAQMDSIFRQSKRMDTKWDRKARGNKTYGDITIQNAIEHSTGSYSSHHNGAILKEIKDSDMEKTKTHTTYLKDENALSREFAEFFRETKHYFFVKDSQNSGDKFYRTILLYNQERGVYEIVNHLEFKAEIRKCLPKELFSRSLIDKIYDDLTMIGKGDPHMINASEINANERCINFTNGIYDTKYNKLLEHSPKLISTIQIPCTFDPGTVPSCPAIWKNFIAHCFDNDEEQINLLYKIFGVAISNIKAWRGKKAFFIIGPGDTGKTLLRNLLCHLIGKENCGTEDLHKLNDRFHMSVLDKKRLGGYSDMSTVTVKDWTLFKNLVGGDPVQIEFKNKDLYSATFDGLLLFTANQMPPCPPDTEPEVFNRMCIMKTIGIAYDKDAKPSPDAVEKDPNLLWKLLADDVKQYIVYQAIQGLRDFIKDNWSYHIPTKNQKHLEEYRESVDSVKAFVKSCCVKVSDCSGKIDRFSACTFYKVYCNWCGEAGFGKYMLGKSDFHNSLYNLGYGLTTEYCGNDSFNLLTLNQTIRKKYNIKPISKKSVKISDAP